MDHILADRHLIPPASEPYYCEKVLRMPDGHACYEPSVDAPEVDALPAQRRGHVTLGSLNNPVKITPQVITLAGETFAGRQSLTHLCCVGLEEMAARDVPDYIDRAAAWAGDLPRLAALRAGLRAGMAVSPLCDGRRFAANLTALLRHAWQRWCREQR
jgi:predicted O-linked N-acetylglucosamine transferase (SPINDLY family)